MSMSIERVNIASDHDLEGMLRRQGKKAGVIICHPHPLYGGNMYNNVVSAIEDGYAAQGYTTLIFNFRGVGDSKGEYDEGEGEIHDGCAAYELLAKQLDDDAHITLAGYSFGAWVVSRSALEIKRFDSLFLVSFPCLIYKYNHLKTFDKEIFIVGGTYDDIAWRDTAHMTISPPWMTSLSFTKASPSPTSTSRSSTQLISTPEKKGN